ncbi:hypothetical protein [Litoribacillus peritrichatus]|uniref:Transcriptional regulator SutA RNAP-binding domain-containing protein n=1 Tax=Litoribacillus peritrichatus TaxID=718191 RepID=A0ABP7MDX1_9GAMM
MKRKPTKAQLREMMSQDILSYESNGGSVQQINSGVSGVVGGPLKAQETVLFDEKKEPRSYVNDVVAAIDSRKKSAHKKKAKPRTSKPKRKLVYDDFGEPLRWVWEDE